MYLLDANVFIEAHRRYYSFDIVPSFWGNLKSLAQTSRICSIDKIQNELCPVTDNPDLLHQWTSEEFNEYFKSVEEYDVLASYGEIQSWSASSEHFTDEAKREFARNADAWIVAYAKAKGYTVVTHEGYNPQKRNRILIPVACEAFNIPYTDTFNMLRDLNITI